MLSCVSSHCKPYKVRPVPRIKDHAHSFQSPLYGTLWFDFGSDASGSILKRIMQPKAVGCVSGRDIGCFGCICGYDTK